MREMKMKILDVIRSDKEIQQLRQEWKEKFTRPFPGWNYDCFGGIDNYKQRIKMALEAGDTKNICESCSRKTCEQLSRATKNHSLQSDKETT